MNRKRRIRGMVVRVPKRLLVYRDYQRKCSTWFDWRHAKRMADLDARIAQGGLTEEQVRSLIFKAVYADDFLVDSVPLGLWPWDADYKPHVTTTWEVVT